MLVLQDLLPHNLGIRIGGGGMDVFFKSNSSIPAKATREFVTVRDNQKSVTIKVYEGEDQLVQNNVLLG